MAFSQNLGLSHAAPTTGMHRRIHMGLHCLTLWLSFFTTGLGCFCHPPSHSDGCWCWSPQLFTLCFEEVDSDGPVISEYTLPSVRCCRAEAPDITGCSSKCHWRCWSQRTEGVVVFAALFLLVELKGSFSLAWNHGELCFQEHHCEDVDHFLRWIWNTSRIASELPTTAFFCWGGLKPC